MLIAANKGSSGGGSGDGQVVVGTQQLSESAQTTITGLPFRPDAVFYTTKDNYTYWIGCVYIDGITNMVSNRDYYYQANTSTSPKNNAFTSAEDRGELRGITNDGFIVGKTTSSYGHTCTYTAIKYN